MTNTTKNAIKEINAAIQILLDQMAITKNARKLELMEVRLIALFDTRDAIVK